MTAETTAPHLTDDETKPRRSAVVVHASTGTQPSAKTQISAPNGQ